MWPTLDTWRVFAFETLLCVILSVGIAIFEWITGSPDAGSTMVWSLWYFAELCVIVAMLWLGGRHLFGPWFSRFADPEVPLARRIGGFIALGGAAICLLGAFTALFWRLWLPPDWAHHRELVLGTAAGVGAAVVFTFLYRSALPAELSPESRAEPSFDSRPESAFDIEIVLIRKVPRRLILVIGCLSLPVAMFLASQAMFTSQYDEAGAPSWFGPIAALLAIVAVGCFFTHAVTKPRMRDRGEE